MTNLLMILTFAHFAALSQIESGDNYFAVGLRGERTRYQIIPKTWKEYTAGAPDFWVSTNPIHAKKVCEWIWMAEIKKFEKKYHRQPNNQELYMLWHQPAKVLHPNETSQRFANLVEKFENEQVR